MLDTFESPDGRMDGSGGARMRDAEVESYRAAGPTGNDDPEDEILEDDDLDDDEDDDLDDDLDDDEYDTDVEDRRTRPSHGRFDD